MDECSPHSRVIHEHRHIKKCKSATFTLDGTSYTIAAQVPDEEQPTLGFEGFVTDVSDKLKVIPNIVITWRSVADNESISFIDSDVSEGKLVRYPFKTAC
ncbi:hypothetical protein Ahia01_000362000 [Argonauta hians]